LNESNQTMIEHVDSTAFEDLCQNLSKDRSKSGNAWPAKQLDRMKTAGVYRWFVPIESGGFGWSNLDISRAYLKLSQACLSSTFVLTQRIAALKRIAASPNQSLVQAHLPRLLSGETTATVGISHLTTSRLHLQRPVLTAHQNNDGYRLNGLCPWVTGANAATHLLVGGIVVNGDDAGKQVLGLVPTEDKNVVVDPGFELIALTETHTGKVNLNDVLVTEESLVVGPHENALASLSSGPSTGSFQSSALALGLTAAAINFIATESKSRPDLQASADSLLSSHATAVDSLLQAASGDPTCSNEQLRTDANSLVLRATQAAMVAAKGAGFMADHPVGRWCREAMFFLVWSCPQAVQDANLCELAGVE
jgi:alkylation response protein AidB-like acyl-CoA dehydrogenase